MRVMKVAEGAEAQGRDDEALLRQLPALLPGADDDAHRPIRPQPRGVSNAPPDGGYGVFNKPTATTTCRSGCRRRLPHLLHRQVPERLRGARRVRDTSHGRPRGLGRLARAPPLARPVLRLHAEQERLRCASTPMRRRTTAPTSSPEGAALHPLEREDRQTPFFLELGYAAPHGGGGGEPGALVATAGRPRAAPPLGPSRGGSRARCRPPSTRPRSPTSRRPVAESSRRSTAGSDRGHPAQAPLRLGVAARSRRERRHRQGAPARRPASRTPTSSFSPTTASCAASTGSATTSATSTRSPPGCRSSPGAGDPPRRELRVTWSSTPTSTSTILELAGAGAGPRPGRRVADAEPLNPGP